MSHMDGGRKKGRPPGNGGGARGGNGGGAENSEESRRTTESRPACRGGGPTVGNPPHRGANYQGNSNRGGGPTVGNPSQRGAKQQGNYHRGGGGGAAGMNRFNNHNNMFDPYLDLAELRRRRLATSALGPAALIEGGLRINPKSYEDAFVCAPDGTADIYIKGIRNRNRALHGDTVIVEINPVTEWNILHETIQDYLDRDGSEEDYQILHAGSIINIKKETSPEVEVRVEIDTFSNPGNRSQPDTIAFPVNTCVKEGEGAKAKPGDPCIGGNWGPGNIGSSAWDTSGVKSDPLATQILSDVQLNVPLGSGGGSLVYSVGQAAVDLPPSQRVAIQRCTNTLLPSQLPLVPGGAGGADPGGDSDDLSDDGGGVGVVVVGLEDVETIQETDESDYESEASMPEDLDQRIEDEAFRLANLGLNPEEEMEKQSAPPAATGHQGEEDSSSDDVIVEGEEGDRQAGGGAPAPSLAGKKTRRGKRGKKGKKSEAQESIKEACGTAVDSLNASVVEIASPPQQQQQQQQQERSRPAQGKPAWNRKPPKVPLVEFQLEAVMRHPLVGQFLHRTGRVVNILEFKHSRKATGTLKLLADRNTSFALFSPTDSRVPRMKIPIQECPPNFLQRSEDYENTMFVAELLRWDMTNSALGTLVRNLGEKSDIEVRTVGLLMEYGIDDSDFPDEVLADLPPNHDQWSIPEQELARRRDFRRDCVFTIDPLTARDLDDALSVTRLANGDYLVGVHIADVSYFVNENTALDKMAADRATSTYLVQKVVPMLPRPLCENLCSLNPGKDRLCYTVEWTMSGEGEIRGEWFGRTVIRSCVKLAYEHAQSMLDHPHKEDWQEGEIPPIEAPYTVKTISEKVNMLQHLAVKLRTQREVRGYLKLDQPKLCFTLNPDTGLPNGFKLHEHQHSNRLIEEFMLLANMAVAKKIYSAFPQLAVLRRHKPPKKIMLDQLVAQMKVLGIPVNPESAGALGESISRLQQHPGSARSAVMNCLFSKPMELAQYFCSGMFNEPDFHHFALNVPFYTHFTSPIRRYPDILVHRLLEFAVSGGSPTWSSKEIQQEANHCNDKKLAAKRIGEASAELFLGLFIAESGPISQHGAVVSVLDHAVDVLLVELGFVKRVYMDKLDITTFSNRRVQGINYLDLVWKNGRKQTLTLFSPVNLSLTKSDRPFEFSAVIESPNSDPDTITID